MPSYLRATMEDLRALGFIFVQGVLLLNTTLPEKCQPRWCWVREWQKRTWVCDWVQKSLNPNFIFIFIKGNSVLSQMQLGAGPIWLGVGRISHRDNKGTQWLSSLTKTWCLLNPTQLIMASYPTLIC